MVVLGGLYLLYEKKRSLIIIEQRRKMFEDDIESDFESNKSGSERNVGRDIESGDKSTSSSSDSLEGPRGPGSRRLMDNSFSTDVSLESALREMAGSSQMQSRPRKGDERSSISSRDSDSSGSSDSGTTTSHHSGATSASDDSDSSSDDSSSDESDESSRKAAATTVVRKNTKQRLSTDEGMTEEIKACWNDPSLKQHERITKINEIKARYNNIKKLQEEAESESFQRSLKQFRGGKQSEGENRRITVDGSGGGNPRSRISARRLSDARSEVSSGRNSLIRRKALTRTMSAENLGNSDNSLNRSSHSNTLRRRSSVGAERRNSFSSSQPDLAKSDQFLDRKRLSLSVGAETNRYGERRNSFTRRNDLSNSDQNLERKKFSSMKAWQRPSSRRLSL